MTNLKQVISERLVGRYKKWTAWTLVTLYLLILVGGIVRATGAGMGCPDWPRCFGSWVPPTDVSELPLNYKEIYGAKLKGEVEFNVVKTWIEYVNRLFGVFTGAWIFMTLLASVPFLKSALRSIFYLSLTAFLLVVFQGWLGSKVVSTELHPGMVTLHMLLAIVIVFVLLFSYAKVSHIERVKIGKLKNGRRKLNIWILTAIALSTMQVILGTQVREQVDMVVAELGYGSRAVWIDNVGMAYWIHRSFSLLVLASVFGVVYFLREATVERGLMNSLSNIMVGVLLAEVGSGIILGYLAVPAFLQPVHLTLAVVMLSIQFVLFLFLNADRIFEKRSLVMSPAL